MKTDAHPSCVDFRELRERLSFSEVLRHYGVTLREHGNQWHGYCPLPTHVRHDMKPRSPSFSANVAKGLWQCFGCGTKGNVLDFAIRMEGLDPDDRKGLCEGAERVSRIFGTLTEREHEVPKTESSAVDMPVIVNAPLPFVLRGLDPLHPYLRNRGFTDEIIKLFGLGYCDHGVMKGRIAIPIHDQSGVLVGYAGRIVVRIPTQRDR